MPCTPIKLGGGGVAIVCTRGVRHKPCCACGRLSSLLCDWKLKGPKKGKTCSAPICGSCATKPAILVDGVEVVQPNVDLCPAHGRLWRQHPKHPANARCGSEAEGDGLDQLLGRGYVAALERGEDPTIGKSTGPQPEIDVDENGDPVERPSR